MAIDAPASNGKGKQPESANTYEMPWYVLAHLRREKSRKSVHADFGSRVECRLLLQLLGVTAHNCHCGSTVYRPKYLSEIVGNTETIERLKVRLSRCFAISIA